MKTQRIPTVRPIATRTWEWVERYGWFVAVLILMAWVWVNVGA